MYAGRFGTSPQLSEETRSAVNCCQAPIIHEERRWRTVELQLPLPLPYAIHCPACRVTSWHRPLAPLEQQVKNDGYAQRSPAVYWISRQDPSPLLASLRRDDVGDDSRLDVTSFSSMVGFCRKERSVRVARTLHLVRHGHESSHLPSLPTR